MTETVRGTDGDDDIDKSIDRFGEENSSDEDGLVYLYGGNDYFKSWSRDAYLSSRDTVWAGSGNDTVYAGGAEDLLYGEDGDDLLLGGNNPDTLYGGNGNDYIDGGSGKDNAYGGAGNDTITASGDNYIFGDFEVYEASQPGLTYDDVLYGDDDNDSQNFYGGYGNDLVFAGPGYNSIYGESGNDTLDGGWGLDKIWGGDGDDNLIGGGEADLLVGESGNDTLEGGEGNDTLEGGLGNDIYRLTAADDASDVIRENPGEGSDTYEVLETTWTLMLDSNVENLSYLGASNFTVYGSSAANILRGNVGDDALWGQGGSDTLFGARGRDSLFGGPGDDVLDGGTADDFMAGGDGNDGYVVEIASDVVYEDPDGGIDFVATGLPGYTLGDNVEALAYLGSDRFTGTGNALDNNIKGGSGDDSLRGMAGGDFLDGGDGNDTLDGGIGADLMIGGRGDDRYIVDDANDTIDEASGTDTVETALASFSLENWLRVEDLAYSGVAAFAGTGNALANRIEASSRADTLRGLAGNDTLIGNGGDDSLEGGDGLDSLVGGDGNDTLDGGTSGDSLSGGAGNDTYVVSTDDQIVELPNAGTDTIRTSLSSYSLASHGEIENLLHVGYSAFQGTGNDLDNSITGGAGNDTLNGLAGNDTLIGLDGDDTYVLLIGDETVVEQAGGGTDAVFTSQVSHTLADHVENLTYQGNSRFTGTGNALANSITGGSGDDTLDGRGGIDTLVGGIGSDTYVLTTGDVVVELAAGGTDTITTYDQPYTLGANVEHLTFLETLSSGVPMGFRGTGNELNNRITGGRGADTLTGLGGNDTLVGNDGDDSLSGGEGGDSLNGGAGNDTLDGGGGNDTFDGGAGDDTYIVEANSEPVRADPQGTDTIRTSASSYSLAGLSSIEHLAYVGTGSFAGTGNGLANSITGGAGNDTLDGLAGADTLVGLGGNDTYVVRAETNVVEAAGGGTDTVTTYMMSFTLGTNVENLGFLETVGSGLPQTFAGNGNELANSIGGGIGNDTLLGFAGRERFPGMLATTAWMGVPAPTACVAATATTLTSSTMPATPSPRREGPT